MTDAEASRTRAGPLEGITVIDLGQIYLGPYAGFLMAKAGARVLKIEPLQGEAARSRAEVNPGALLPFEMLNANKRGIALDLKSERGREILRGLARHADVLIENFAPGVADRLGVGWSVLREDNSRLVYGTATGYGLSGPDRDGLAMDVTIQAAAGVMSVTGMADGPPLKAGVAVADFMGGVHLYAGIMTALVERSITGLGQRVEIAMQEAVVPSLASSFGMAFDKPADTVLRTGNRHGGLAICPYNVYRASDGNIALIAVQEIHWRRLTEAMGRPELADDPAYATNAARVARMDDVDALIEDWTARQGVHELFEQAKSRRIPCAPVRDVHDVLSDPHMHQRGMLEWVENPRLGRIVQHNSPLRFSAAEGVPTRPAPELGEDTAAILEELLGLDEAHVNTLAAEGVVRLAPRTG